MRETQALAANFDLLLKSIHAPARQITAPSADGSEETDGGTKFKQHEAAHEDFLMNAFGRCNE